MEYTIPKGVFDVVPWEPQAEDSWRNADHWQYVERVMRQTANDYGFKEIRTPIFERTELFVRGVGEGSDIVSKEMYTFLDKGERSMTLRPEGTASVMRSFVEKRLYNLPSLHKFFYIGPMFRYERPQAGRYRQHHQFGAEAIGNSKPEQDVELIDMLCELYRRLGLKDLVVMVNTVGDEESRLPYKQALTAYLRPRFDELSADSQVRLSKNVLRILDSKDPKDQKILEQAPSIFDTLNTSCKEHFRTVCKLLEKLGLKYVVNSKLVRGLDYYNKTVFEVISGDLGAQNTVGAGGRYDGLIKTLGGPDLPAVGYATGIERLLQTMAKQQVAFPPPECPLVFFIPMGEESLTLCFEWVSKLRHEKIPVEIDLSGKKIQHGLQLANALGAEYSIVVGEQEIATKMVKLKNMQTRESIEVSLDDLLTHLKSLKHDSFGHNSV